MDIALYLMCIFFPPVFFPKVESRRYSNEVLEKWQEHFAITQAGVQAGRVPSGRHQCQRKSPFSTSGASCCPGAATLTPACPAAQGLAQGFAVCLSSLPAADTGGKGLHCRVGSDVPDAVQLHCHIHMKLTGRDVTWCMKASNMFRSGLCDELRLHVVNIFSLILPANFCFLLLHHVCHC